MAQDREFVNTVLARLNPKPLKKMSVTTQKAPKNNLWVPRIKDVTLDRQDETKSVQHLFRGPFGKDNNYFEVLRPSAKTSHAELSVVPIG